jgi:hypothetical protein
MKLETERLILREPKISDWKDIVEGLSDVEIAKNLIKVKYPYTKRDALENIISKNGKRKKRKIILFILN